MTVMKSKIQKPADRIIQGLREALTHVSSEKDHSVRLHVPVQINPHVQEERLVNAKQNNS
jgi:hypothetical protein